MTDEAGAGWRRHPVLYEINTWVWLDALGRSAGRKLSLATVPEVEIERLAGLGIDAVWLMGVWRRSPKGREIALSHPDLRASYRAALPDFTSGDVVGSPYAVYDYTVDPALGGDEALAELRRRLRRRGLRLVLDFVPNHFALDHPWVREHPERFVHGSANDLDRAPSDYFVASGTVFAHGRDPNFPGWTDTIQVDYRRPDTRRAMADVLLSIAERCDGVRCDMAMLVMCDIFLRTWGGCFEPELAEFWPTAITDVRVRHPGFLFLAEVYWDLEWELQRQGFDYCYDKRLYDRLLASDAAAVAAHLCATLDYQRGLARFIENHDERRAAEAFGPEASRAASGLALTLPGLKLLHDGQLEGRRVRVPVQLGRRPVEPVDLEMERFYHALLAAVRSAVFREGEWQLLEPRSRRASRRRASLRTRGASATTFA